MNATDYKKLGARVREKRREKGYTQEQLAEMCEISTGFLGHIENGTRIPSLDTLCRIASSLEVSVDFLLLDSGTEKDNSLQQIASSVRSQNPERYRRFLNAVKILAEHIDEL